MAEGTSHELRCTVQQAPLEPARKTPTLDPYVMRYIAERVRRGEVEPVTVRGLRCHLLGFAHVYGHRPLTGLGPKALERYVEHMVAEGLALSTQRSRMSSIRVFARWCAANDVTRKDWSIGAPTIRHYRQTPRDMTNDMASAILAQARDERERLLVLLCFGCGLRCIEIHRLDVSDMERNPSQLFVKGKGGHERYVPVPPVVERAIDAYLAAAGHHTGPLIRTAPNPSRWGPSCHNGGTRLGAARISGLVGYLVRASGVKVRSYDGRSAHGLRAAAASDMYDAAGDVRVVQAFLGHANIQTTSIYLRRAGVDQVREAQALRPLSGGLGHV